MAIVKRIGTHSGIFHCDEALACFMLKKLPEYTDAEIVRTRDRNALDKCDIVVDVGDVYDPAKHRYDHHQKTFSLTMNSLVPTRPWKIRLSSAGLIYHHFAERVFEAILKKPLEPVMSSKMFNYIYEHLIIEIDAIDNGIPMFAGEPAYRINTSLSTRVSWLNPDWNSTEEFDSDKKFNEAMNLTGEELVQNVQHFVSSFWPARTLVKEAVANRFKVHPSGEIMELVKTCPWKEHLMQIQEEDELGNAIKFVIFKADFWRVQAVPLEPKSFICHVFLNNKWMGLRDEELCRVSEIDDCVFVHSTGFIGGNKTREGAIAMALRSLQLDREES